MWKKFSIVFVAIGISLILLKEQIGAKIMTVLCSKYAHDGVGDGIRVVIRKAGSMQRNYITLTDTEGYAVIVGIAFIIIAFLVWFVSTKRKQSI